jgi:hypothetical protein
MFRALWLLFYCKRGWVADEVPAALCGVLDVTEARVGVVLP